MIQAYVLIRLSSPGGDTQTILRTIDSIPNVQSVSSLYGPDDAIADVHVNEADDTREMPVLFDTVAKIRAVNGVLATDTRIVAVRPD